MADTHDCLDYLDVRCSGESAEWLECAVRGCGNTFSFEEAKQAAEDRLAAELAAERRVA